MPKKRSTYEGLQEDIRKKRMQKIEVWENKYPDKDYTIDLEFAEFTCICPKTGLPDFAAIHIQYVPDRLCIELKSFKLYLVAYRQVGIFHEHVVNKILEDFVRACRPRWVKIVGEFNIRGGIKTTVTAEYRKKLEKR